MNVINIRNVHRAIPLALMLLRSNGTRRESRYGPVTVVDGPVTTVYQRPKERVELWAHRDANPFFHLYESLWMLAGRNDVEPLARYAKRMRTFSDDGDTFHGAYGYRWRSHRAGPAGDQLSVIIKALKQNPDCRRQVLQIWDTGDDLGLQSKDLPCNLMVTFQIGPHAELQDKRGKAKPALNMVVFNRSNDVVWGCYGANAVHFSMLLEYMAAHIGVEVGTYSQISVNWHGYDATFLPLYEKFDADPTEVMELPCMYEAQGIVPYPLVSPGTSQLDWDADVTRFVTNDGRAPSGDRWHDPFFRDVALPLMRAHDAYKDMNEGRWETAFAQVAQCKAEDWRLACEAWLLRRNMITSRGARGSEEVRDG